MSNTTVANALAHVADVLESSEYSDREVLIMIPNILLADQAATEKYLQDFDKISTFSLANEPGTQKFCAFQSRGSEGVSPIWVIEHFDSESSLAKHRESVAVKDMLSWLQKDQPNGTHPLPVPIPLRATEGSFVRHTLKQVQDPFVVMTRIECAPEDSSSFEAWLLDFAAETTKQAEDVLMFLPAKGADKETWIIMTVYRTKRAFEEEGLTKKRFEGVQMESGVRGWQEHFLELKVGYMSRS